MTDTEILNWLNGHAMSVEVYPKHRTLPITLLSRDGSIWHGPTVQSVVEQAAEAERLAKLRAVKGGQ